jgi:hypothetical protein
MAFVKVVGGTEIYNFGIQSLVHFSTNFGVNQFQTGAQQIIEGPGALCTAMSRRPRAAPVRRSPRRPCPHTAQAMRIP